MKNETQKLYEDFFAFRSQMFVFLVTINPSYDKLILFQKTQKLLFDFLVVFFAEAKDLLEKDFVAKNLQKWQKSKKCQQKKDLYFCFKEEFN